MDALLLARIQFAVTVGFHFLFPPITIGLAWILVIFEWIGWKKGDKQYARIGKFFGDLFAVTFAVGVATGIVMEFQFGTNWAEYSKYVGDIFGAPLAAEGVFAFFLESFFVGVYLFARGRISKGAHWFSALMVAFGATLSAFWIIVANSWQQTPAGYTINETLGRAELTDFWAAVFNPSTMIRYLHTVNASIITGAFFVVAASAYMIIKGRDTELMKKAMKIGLIVAFISSILQAEPLGSRHATQVAHTQPEKLAVIEGVYKTSTNVPMLIFGFPVSEPEPHVVAPIGVPSLLSILVGGSPDTEIKGVDAFPKEDIAPLWLPFVSYHNMVGLGLFFILYAGVALFLNYRKKLYDMKWYLWIGVLTLPAALSASQFGWIAAEVGRQPWVVWKILRTSDAHSTNVAASDILISLVILSLIYSLLGAIWIFLLKRKVDHGVPELKGRKEVAA